MSTHQDEEETLLPADVKVLVNKIDFDETVKCTILEGHSFLSPLT